MPAGEVSHRPPGRLEGPCSPRHEALLAGAWKDLASLHRAALIRDHRRPRTASAWRPRALARRAALRWFGSFDSLCRRTPGGRGSQKWLRGPLPFGRGTASGTSSVATAARRAAARRCWRWWFEVGIVQSSVDESRASAGRVPCLCGKWQIYLFDQGLEVDLQEFPLLPSESLLIANPVSSPPSGKRKIGPEYHVRIAPLRKPCQQFTLGYVRKSHVH